MGWIIPAASAAAGLIGSLISGSGESDYDKLIQQILRGEAGGLPPELRAQLSENVRGRITEFGEQLKGTAESDFNTRNLWQSGLLTERYEGIDESSMQAYSDALMRIETMDAEMRNRLLSRLISMGDPGAAQQSGWGDLFGAGLSGLSTYFGTPRTTGGGAVV